MQRVLLLEPDKILAKTYLQHLLLAGFDAVVVHDGQDAVHEIENSKPDVMIVELQLAGHSGIEFLHEVRSYEDWADIPVVVTSSVPKDAFKVDERAWQRLGVERYLYKPKTTAKQLIGAVLALSENK